MTGLRVMVVDDDQSTCDSLGKVLQAEGHRVQTFTDGIAARRELDENATDVLVTDVVMSPLSGTDLLAHVVERGLDAAVILVTGYGDIPSAVDAVHQGAYDYLPKPVVVERLCLQVTRAGRQVRLQRENKELKERLAASHAAPRMLGHSPAMQALRQELDRAAASDATVLITGETGVGKELVAQTLYREGLRADRPFVVVNCAAVPATLVESEFFGHERGAFTGALKRRRGRFELAHGGTLFLDEVGDIDLQAQVKLLRVLQERTFERVGGSETVAVDVRVIAATRHDLAGRVESGEFREDLYYRLSVVCLRVPALRERAADIPVLAEAFLDEMAAAHGRPRTRLSAEAMAALVAYPWPGNVRELRNCVESLVVMARGSRIGIEELPVGMRTGDASETQPLRSMSDIEREAIMSTLARVGGNRRAAARALDIGLKTLYRRLHDYGILGQEEGGGSD